MNILESEDRYATEDGKLKMIRQKEVSDKTAILFMTSVQKLDFRNCEEK